MIRKSLRIQSKKLTSRQHKIHNINDLTFTTDNYNRKKYISTLTTNENDAYFHITPTTALLYSGKYAYCALSK